MTLKKAKIKYSFRRVKFMLDKKEVKGLVLLVDRGVVYKIRLKVRTDCGKLILVGQDAVKLLKQTNPRVFVGFAQEKIFLGDAVSLNTETGLLYKSTNSEVK